ncbi:MAG TPA: DegT/DnrJ/EryC1/StrS aminotransferase family protein [Gaiellaceae bacterium]|nr:DegT/DnrJ/EryC1/StrS aminotransferase family protein [Gaiellaceae bacterium]
MSAHERIVFGLPWLDEAEEELVRQTLRSGWIGQGPLVELFEERLRDYLDAKHVVAVGSCTAGLHLALVALGIGPGDEVITTPFTFVATLNAITHAGATPVLVDVDAETLNLAPERVAGAITPRTAAVLPVHFGGRPLDVVGYGQLADEHGLWIVEDAAHAIGAVAAGRRVGGQGHPRVVSVFSFYPNKNLASAEGGAIALADGDVADRLRRLRLHGLDVDAWKRYRTGRYRPSLATEPGFKYNWTDLQAAIALGQLEKLEGFLAIREYLAEVYDRLLAEVPAVRVVDRGRPGLDYRHALHLYQVAVQQPPPARDHVVARLLDQGIGAAVHYIGVNRHPAYRTEEPYPVSDWASDALVTLPLHPQLDDDHLARVVGALGQALDEASGG